MIIDITGTELIPGNDGADCPGNGMHEGVECCCDECAYMLCCVDPNWQERCPTCWEQDCPHAQDAAEQADALSPGNVSHQIPNQRKRLSEWIALLIRGRYRTR